MAEVITGPPPPATNRGVEMSQGAQIGLGWIDGSAWFDDPGGLLEVMTKHLGPSDGAGPGTAFYGTSAKFDRGRALVHWNGKQNAAGTSRAEVKQQALDGLGFAGGLALLVDLKREGFMLSRLDEWVDDYDGRITPDRVRAAVNGSQAVTHARPGRWVHNDEDGSSTYYLGAPSSDRRVRTYDKRGPVRMELQARNDWARANGRALLRSIEPERAVLSNLVSFVDFRESRARDRDGHRVARLDWWESLVGDAAKAEGAPSRPRLSLEELALYALQYWSKSLAVLDREMGPDFIDQLLRAGRERLGEEDQEGVRASA